MTAIAVPPPQLAARPLDMPPAGFPADILGEKCTYVWKPMIQVGQLEHPNLGWVYDVTQQEAEELVSECKRFTANGNKTFLPDRHMEEFDANANNGWVPNYELKDGVVWGLHQLVGDKAREKAAKNDTSVYIEFGKRDGRGNVYKKVITHNALCPDPVAGGLGGFAALAASQGHLGGVVAVLNWKQGTPIAAAASTPPVKPTEPQTQKQENEMKLTPEQLAQAQAELGAETTEDNFFTRAMSRVLEDKGKIATSTTKLAASVSVMDRPAAYLINPVLEQKVTKAMSRGVTKAAIDKVIAAFRIGGKPEADLAPLAFSQSAAGDQPVIFSVLDGLAENEPGAGNADSAFGAQGSSIALSGSASGGSSANGKSAEDEAIDATLCANGLLAPATAAK